MTWQDLTFSIGAVIFGLNAWGNALDAATRIRRRRSVTTALVLTLYVAVHLSDHRLSAALSTVVTASGWWAIAAWRRA